MDFRRASFYRPARSPASARSCGDITHEAEIGRAREPERKCMIEQWMIYGANGYTGSPLSSPSERRRNDGSGGARSSGGTGSSS